jgi:hypothetical protein
MTDKRRIPWHDLLGKALADALIGLPYRVSTEEELALRSQRLDVLIIEQAQASPAASVPEAVVPVAPAPEALVPVTPSPDTPAPETLAPEPPEGEASAAKALLQRPDGLEDLAAHNLLSYKAGSQAYDAWALEELVSHYVTYRKLASLRVLRHRAADDDTPIAEPAKAYPLLPATDFRCLAIATRFPRKLIKQLPPGSCQRSEQPGIFQLRAGTRAVRLVVINDLRPLPHNAPWRLFSSDEAQRRLALQQYHPRSEIGVHLHNLIAHYKFGDGNMAHTFEDMQREAREWIIEHYLDQLAPEERLKGLDAEERLKGLDPEDIFKHYDPEERLKGLDEATIEAWLAKQRRDH